MRSTAASAQAEHGSCNVSHRTGAQHATSSLNEHIRVLPEQRLPLWVLRVGLSSVHDLVGREEDVHLGMQALHDDFGDVVQERPVTASARRLRFVTRVEGGRGASRNRVNDI